MDRDSDHAGLPAGTASTDDGPALRDAGEILERADADEADAEEARRRYRVSPMPRIDPDPAVASYLLPDEHVLAVRHSIVVDRRGPNGNPTRSECVAGDLYLTTRRIVVVGRTLLSFDLSGIEEATASAARLMLILDDGTGLAFDVDRPSLLRVEISTARAALRG
jgi:hypothetical protein